MRQPILAIYTFCVLLSIAFLSSSFSNNSFEEYGKAAYYADALHGRKTASGVKYDKKAYTCAHKTLPFGTKLRVTRLDNQLAVIVTVNDRGPFKSGFVVDISRKAAEEINLVKDGIANVKIEVIPTAGTNSKAVEPVVYNTSNKQVLSSANNAGAARLLIPQSSGATQPSTYSTQDPRPATIQSINKSQPGVKTKAVKQSSTGTSDLYKVQTKKTPKTGSGVQVSTLYAAENILPEVTKLEKYYPGRVLVSVTHDDATDQSTYRIIIGSYPDRKSAEQQQKALAKKGYPKCFIVSLNEL
jgi:rare lipoprotein A